VAKIRADVLLVSRGLAPSRERARAYILAGKVFRGEQRVDKAGEKLAEDTVLTVRGVDHPYVSRGGVKLEGALDSFGWQVDDVVAADFGASTGGFTDCLLQRGAARVFAIDVGYGQLHPRLRSDPRVVVMERTNARYVKLEDLGAPVNLVVIDASFIGLEKLLPAVRAILAPGGRVLAMVKPQFQVGKGEVGKGGVVRDPEKRRGAIQAVADAAKALGFDIEGQADAAIKGPKGNHEAFLALRLPA